MKRGNNRKAADNACLRFAVILRMDSLRTLESAGGMEPWERAHPGSPRRTSCWSESYVFTSLAQQWKAAGSTELELRL